MDLFHQNVHQGGGVSYMPASDLYPSQHSFVNISSVQVYILPTEPPLTVPLTHKEDKKGVSGKLLKKYAL